MEDDSQFSVIQLMMTSRNPVEWKVVRLIDASWIPSDALLIKALIGMESHKYEQEIRIEADENVFGYAIKGGNRTGHAKSGYLILWIEKKHKGGLRKTTNPGHMKECDVLGRTILLLMRKGKVGQAAAETLARTEVADKAEVDILKDADGDFESSIRKIAASVEDRCTRSVLMNVIQASEV